MGSGIPDNDTLRSFGITFGQLLAWDDEERRRWLVESQPDGEHRTNWWLSIIQPLNGLTTRFGDVSGQEVANRLAMLASVVSEYPELADVPPELTPDGAARRNLGNIRLSREEALRMAENRTDRPIEEIRELREVRTLVRRLGNLVDRIRDDHLRHEVREWPAVQGRLP